MLTGVLFVLLFLGCPNATEPLSETPKSNNADLQSLEVKDAEGTVIPLSPAFSAEKTSYTVTVPYATKNLTITGKTADSKATMEPENSEVTVNNLEVGVEQTAIIKVRAEDGTEKIYTVTVTREAVSSNAYLQSLKPSEGSLSPTFNAATLEYTVIVPYSVENQTVTVTGTANANATMTPSGGKLSFADFSEGTSDKQTIKVTAEDGTTTQEYKVKVTRCEEIKMVRVPAGSFQRDKGEENISEITKPYSLSKYQITRKQFLDIMGEDPSEEFDEETDGNLPVQNVNWYHAIAFCNKLSLLEGLSPAYKVSGVSNWADLDYSSIPTSSNEAWDFAECNWEANGYRLPTEMEWMWAAMGADKDYRPEAMQDGINRTGYTKSYAGSIEEKENLENIDKYAWDKHNSDGKTHPVGQKQPNELGLYDMSGNVSEWCWDLHDRYSLLGKQTDYKGADFGSSRVHRGGSWIDEFCAVAFRMPDAPWERYRSLGFRILRPVQ